MAAPALVAHVAPDTAPSIVEDAVGASTALPSIEGDRWVVVDPPQRTVQALRRAPWCRALDSAWTVAVVLDAEDLAPQLSTLRSAADDTIVVFDPDFGRVAYVSFDSPQRARAALEALPC